MTDSIGVALKRDRIVDITTTGRRSGKARRIEIWMFHVDGELYITGRPGRRGWYANVLADPRLMLHLKKTVQADLPARALPVTNPVARRDVFAAIQQHFPVSVEDMVAASPLVAIELD